MPMPLVRLGPVKLVVVPVPNVPIAALTCATPPDHAPPANRSIRPHASCAQSSSAPGLLLGSNFHSATTWFWKLSTVARPVIRNHPAVHATAPLRTNAVAAVGLVARMELVWTRAVACARIELPRFP